LAVFSMLAAAARLSILVVHGRAAGRRNGARNRLVVVAGRNMPGSGGRGRSRQQLLDRRCPETTVSGGYLQKRQRQMRLLLLRLSVA
jgi:hypothetical protein